MVRETGVQSQVELYQRLKKIVLDAALVNTQYYKVWTKGKVEQFREWSNAFPNASVGNFGSPSSTVENFIYLLILWKIMITKYRIQSNEINCKIRESPWRRG